jgi:hypothetical protein
MRQANSGRDLVGARASRRALTLAMWACVLAPAPVRAVENYFLVPDQSYVQLDAESGFSIELGSSTAFAPFVSQLGIVPGASGLALPGIGASDGLRTSLSGTVRADITSTQIAIQRGGTTLLPARSGTWGPGIPSAPATPASAPLAVAFAAPSLGLTGAAAVRGTAFTLFSLPSSLTPQSATSWIFGAISLVSVLGGVIDFDTNLAAIGGRGFLDPTQQFVSFGGSGLLEDLGGGLRRLTLPFDVTMTLGPSDLGNLPVGATLALSGRIVAYNQVIPEPSAWVLVALGSIGLGVARRAGRGGN